MRASLQRASGWAKLIAVTGSAQVAVQAIGFLSGILVIRLLPTHEYALYTLANTMLGTMTLLADGGISTGVMAQGGKVWQDKEKLGAVLATGLHLRKKFAVFSLIVATPLLFYLLRKHDASWLMSTLIALSLIPAFITGLSGTLLEIVPKLHQDLMLLQKIQASINLGRLVLLSSSLFLYPFTAIAMLCMGVSQIWGNWRLWSISKRYIESSRYDDRFIETEILSVVRRTMPSSVFYCVSGQITVWLMSLYGTTQAVAQVGVLSRLIVLLNIVGVLFTLLVVPRYARLPDQRKLLLSRFLQIECGLFAFCAIIVFFISMFPEYILLIFGQNYYNLTSELILVGGVGALGIISSATYHLSVCRGVIVNPVINILLLSLVQLLSFLVFDVATLMGSLWYYFIYVMAEFLIRFSYYFIAIFKEG